MRDEPVASDGPSTSLVGAGAIPDERRRAFLLVRYVLIITVSTLAIVHHPGPLPPSQNFVIAAALASNVALGQIGVDRFFLWWVQSPILLSDTVWISSVLISAGLGQDFFLFYFIELFLAAVSESFGLLAVGAVLIGTASIIVAGAEALSATSLIRLPFFFVTAIFFGYVVDLAKQERRRAAEQDAWAHQLEDQVRVRTGELERQSTELRALYDRVVAANRVQSEFVANMSHELRTPLNTIIGYTDLLVDDPTLEIGPDAQRFLERINASARALHRLVESVLEYAHLERGQARLLPSSFPLDELLRDLQALCDDVGTRPEVSVHLAPAPETEVTTDYNRLYSVLSNLLLNAMKFTARGTIELTMTEDGDSVEFAVRDTGVGIAAHDLEYIFEPFRQVDGSSTRAFGGVGLGLAIVRRNLDLLGGTVEVESQVNVGSNFRVRIPRRIEADTDQPAANQIAVPPPVMPN